MLTMYDDVDLSKVPDDAHAVAGYVNGRWRTYPDVVKKWPKAKHLSIAVDAEHDAETLDVERFDATPSQAPGWVRRQIARKVTRPVVYTNLAQAQAVVKILTVSGVKRSQYRLWTAHYTGVPHLCTSKCGLGFTGKADATQYTDRALNLPLDATLLSDTFFVDNAARRAALRAWILVRRARGWTWARLKKTANWAAWRRLGGK